MNPYHIFLLLAVLATLPGSMAHAQSTYGGVVGTVTDASKAVVPGARVTLVEVQTNVARTATSSEDGTYEFLNLDAGPLPRRGRRSRASRRLTTRAFRGGRAADRAHRRASAGGRSVAKRSRFADVAPLVNTEKPTIVGSKVATASSRSCPSPSAPSTPRRSPTIAVLPEVQKGSRLRLLALGRPDLPERGLGGRHLHRQRAPQRHRQRGQRRVNIFPSVEGIEEIRVSSISNNAEFAQAGDITTITKAGTNDWHGSAFFNFNGDGLNANPNYFTQGPAQRVATTGTTGPASRARSFADKTFFFATYERLSIEQTGVGTATVPEADFRGGQLLAPGDAASSTP